MRSVKPQPQTTRKFRQSREPGYEGLVCVQGSGGRNGEKGAYFSLYGGRNGYLWVGSEVKGCYLTLNLSVLKRLIESAEAP